MLLIHALLGLPADLTNQGVLHAYVDVRLVAEAHNTLAQARR